MRYPSNLPHRIMPRTPMRNVASQIGNDEKNTKDPDSKGNKDNTEHISRNTQAQDTDT